MSVTYSLAALAKRLVHGVGAVQFVTKDDPARALEVYRSAASQIEQTWDEEAADGGDFMASSGYVVVPGGPIGYVFECHHRQLLEAWLEAVSAALDAAGLSGRLQHVVSVSSGTQDGPAVSLAAALVLEYDELMSQPFYDGNAPPGWWVSQARTDRLLPGLVDWCLDTPGDIFVQAGAGLMLPAEAVLEVMFSAVKALQSTSRIQLTRISADKSTWRRLTLSRDGNLVCNIRDETTTLPQQWQQLQDPLRLCAPAAMHAFIRAGAPSLHLSNFWNKPPKTPYAEGQPHGTSPLRTWPLAHLQSEYVPDAYLQQVLTSSQLERINTADGLDPGRWRVEDLGSQRHLVTATNPDPWLALDQRPYTRGDLGINRTPAPDPATLTQAREDFAPALLTPEVVAAHPPAHT